MKPVETYSREDGINCLKSLLHDIEAFIKE